MTDKEKLIALLTEFGVGFSEAAYERRDESRYPRLGVVEINCTAGQDTKVVGYDWFYTVFRFTVEGKFIEMGVYE